MRILIDAKFLTHPQVGGFKTYVECLVNALQKVRGSDEYILCVDRADHNRISHLQGEGFKVVINHSRVPVIREVIREQYNFARIAHAESPDIVHFTCNTGSLNLRRPYVLTLHDVLALNNPYFRFERPLRRSIWAYIQALYQSIVIPRVVYKAACIITVSEYQKKLIANRLCVSPDHIHVVYEAASEAFRRFSDDEEHQWNDILHAKYGITKGYVLAVGSKPEKNIPGLLRAYAVVHARCEDTPLLMLIVPHRAAWRSIESLTEKLGIGGCVAMLSGIPSSDLVGLYNLAQLFVFPSLHEGFGLPPLEAMACGTPVVAANSSSLPEVVGDAALLVDPYDVGDIAKGILNVLTRPDLRYALVQKGFDRVKQFSWDITAKRTVEVYHEAISNIG